MIEDKKQEYPKMYKIVVANYCLQENAKNIPIDKNVLDVFLLNT